MNLKKTKLDAMIVDRLVERFAAITVAQDNALLGGQTAKYNRLYGRMKEVFAVAIKLMKFAAS